MNYKRLLELILLNLDEGIIVTDAKADITFYKEPATNIGGIDSHTAIGKNILDVFPDLTKETSTFYSVINNKKPIIEHIQHYTNYQGKKVSTVTSTIPIFENGEMVGCFEVFKDLTQVVDLSEKIMHLQEQLYKSSTGKKEYNESGAKYTFDNIIGNSEPIVGLKEKARRIAKSNSPVLVYGETGTGKELLVQAIHNADHKRRNKPFIAQNCAALPFSLLESILFGTAAGSFTGAKDNPGLFELAHGGTLYLDEVNSLNIELQAKLLRVIQDGVVRRVGAAKTKDVDVRIIASTNEPPSELVEKKLLREDLYYRLNVIYLELPPLRERREDISVLVRYFIERNNEQLGKKVAGVDKEAMRVFEEYPWPGNVRELEHLVESTMNLIDTETIVLDDIQYYFDKRLKLAAMDTEALPLDTPMGDLNASVDKYEKSLLVKALKASKGNISMAARTLGLPKQTMHNKIKKHNIRLVKEIE
ncbi:MAG TPA: sigma 54-interacting transcriptional regulator [Clostridia bacterium]|nr:sigma 54-interacting transcriptional regulator [Clostridia bacterium]